MEILIAILPIICSTFISALQDYLKYKSQQKKEERKTIDEALAKGDTALLDNLLDGQHKRVSEVLHSHN